MNSAYLLSIHLTLLAPREVDNIELKLQKYLTFIPFNGLIIRLTASETDTEEEISTEIQLDNLVFDCTENVFSFDVEDATIRETFNETGTCTEYGKELYTFYKRLGFSRVNFPQGVAK